jgi:hypothetical protein
MEEKPAIPLEHIQDKLPDFEVKKEEYKLRHYLAYHVVKKKNTKRKFIVEHGNLKISFD